ncbi:hypothetical protein [Nitrincola sp.]|uniref:hypothetical protein n=1 Tax=Nitrincola sp. TaxID=1926584 RepID=UPI003A8DF589
MTWFKFFATTLILFAISTFYTAKTIYENINRYNNYDYIAHRTESYFINEHRYTSELTYKIYENDALVSWELNDIPTGEKMINLLGKCIIDKSILHNKFAFSMSNFNLQVKNSLENSEIIKISGGSFIIPAAVNNLISEKEDFKEEYTNIYRSEEISCNMFKTKAIRCINIKV